LGNIVEVEVSADKPFPDRSMPPVLVIGTKAFAHSRNPADGRTDVLIFTLESTEFDALPDNAEITFGYLHPRARLVPGRAPGPAGQGAIVGGPRAPTVRPDQVDPNTVRVGSLRKATLQVLP